MQSFAAPYQQGYGYGSLGQAAGTPERYNNMNRYAYRMNQPEIEDPVASEVKRDGSYIRKCKFVTNSPRPPGDNTTVLCIFIK